LDARDFLRRYCDDLRMLALGTMHASTGLPVVTIKIAQVESAHENRAS